MGDGLKHALIGILLSIEWTQAFLFKRKLVSSHHVSDQLQLFLAKDVDLEHGVLVAELLVQASDDLLFERGQLLFALIARSFAVHFEVGQMLARSDQIEVNRRRNRMCQEEPKELDANHTKEKIEADRSPTLECQSADVLDVLWQKICVEE